MWVRGLKQLCIARQVTIRTSHPMWVRGLKQDIDVFAASIPEVASYVGAWIETSRT